MSHTTRRQIRQFASRSRAQKLSVALETATFEYTFEVAAHSLDEKLADIRSNGYAHVDKGCLDFVLPTSITSIRVGPRLK